MSVIRVGRLGSRREKLSDRNTLEQIVPCDGVPVAIIQSRQQMTRIVARLQQMEDLVREHREIYAMPSVQIKVYVITPRESVPVSQDIVERLAHIRTCLQIN